MLFLLLPNCLAMNQTPPNVIRENAAEAAQRLEIARKRDRASARIAYAPPDTIDGVPWHSFAELSLARFAPVAKRDRRYDGHLLDDLFPLKNVRSMFMTAYSPNKLEFTDQQIFSFFHEHLIGSEEAFKHIHHGPGREIYMVTHRGEHAILHKYLGPGGFLLYRGHRYYLIHRHTPVQ
jgi:hypothetical protein